MSTLLVSPKNGSNRDEQQANEAFVFALIIGLSLLLSGFVSMFIFKGAGQALQILPVLFGALSAVGGAFMARKGRRVVGVSLAAVAMAATYLFFIFRIGGLGVPLSFTFTLVLLTLAREVYPAADFMRVRILAVSGGLLMLLMDLYWPFSARVESPRVLMPLLFLAIISCLIIAAYTHRRYTRFDTREKVMAAFVSLALFPLMIVVTFSNHSTRQALINDANQRLFFAAQQTAAAVDGFLVASINDVKSDAAILDQTGYLNLPLSERSGSAAESRALAKLKNFWDKNSASVSSYSILDTNGNYLLEYPSSSPGYDETELAYIISPVETTLPHISSIQFSRDPGGPFLYFSTPIYNDDDQVVGLLEARYKAQTLQDLFTERLGLAANQSYAALYDENFQILAHGTQPDVLYQFVGSPPKGRIIELETQQRLSPVPAELLVLDNPELNDGLNNASNESFFIASNFASNGSADQVAVAKLATKPWLVTYSEPHDIFIAPVQAQSRSTVLLALVVSAAVMALVLFLTRHQVAAAVLNDETHTKVRGLLKQQDHTLLEPEHSTSQLAIFNRFSQALIRTHTLDDIYQATGTHLKELVPADHISIALLTDDSDQFQLFDLSETESPCLMRTVSVGEGSLLDDAVNDDRIVVASDPDLYGIPEIRSTMIAPLTVGERTFGTVNVGSHQSNAYKLQDQTLFIQASHLLATTFEERRLLQKTRRQAEGLADNSPIVDSRTTELALLNELARELSALNDIESIMACAYDYSQRTMKVEGFVLALQDISNGDIDVHVFGDAATRNPTLNPGYDNGLIEYAIQKRVSLLQANQLDEKISEFGIPKNGSGAESWIAAPLHTSKRVYGMLALENYSDSGAFGKHEWELLIAIANQTSIAIENSFLFGQEKARERREQILREITSRVRASTDVDSVMRTAAQEVGRALGRQTFVYLTNEDKHSRDLLIEEKQQNER